MYIDLEHCSAPNSPLKSSSFPVRLAKVQGEGKESKKTKGIENDED